MGKLNLAANQLHGVVIEPLKVFADDRGFVKHMLRSDSPLFSSFGEIYFSYTKPFVVKAWKSHRLITQHLAVPQGTVLLVLYDARKDSPTYGNLAELLLGDENYCLVRIPPGFIYGFQAVSANGALVANCIDMTYRPDESSNFPLDEISYQWKTQAVAS